MKELNTMRKAKGTNKIYTSNAGEYDICTAGYNGDMIPIMSVHFCPTLRDGNDNGVFDTDLLEIVRDKLKGLQRGEFACRENALAITHIEEAIMWLNYRDEKMKE